MRFLTDGGVHSTKPIDGLLKNLGPRQRFSGNRRVGFWHPSLTFICRLNEYELDLTERIIQIFKLLYVIYLMPFWQLKVAEGKQNINR